MRRCHAHGSGAAASGVPGSTRRAYGARQRHRSGARHPDNLFIEGNNLTTTKARLLLMAAVIKFGMLPPHVSDPEAHPGGAGGEQNEGGLLPRDLPNALTAA
jgi:hypothetical protein